MSGQASIRVLAIVRAKPGSEDVVREALVANAAASLGEPGCVSYAVHHSVTDPEVFVLLEEYTSPSAFAAHGQTAHIARLRVQLADIVASPSVIHVLGGPQLLGTAPREGGAHMDAVRNPEL